MDIPPVLVGLTLNTHFPEITFVPLGRSDLLTFVYTWFSLIESFSLFIDSSQRFLGSTLDPIIQKGDLKRLDGYIGRLDAYTRSASDRYLEATTPDRTAYQFEPAVTYVDQDTSSINPEDQVKFTATYDDFLNQLKYFNAPVDNQDRLTKEKVYSWNEETTSWDVVE